MLNPVAIVQEDIHLQQADADGSVLGTMPNLPDSSEIPGASGMQLVLWEDGVAEHSPMHWNSGGLRLIKSMVKP